MGGVTEGRGERTGNPTDGWRMMLKEWSHLHNCTYWNNLLVLKTKKLPPLLHTEPITVEYKALSYSYRKIGFCWGPGTKVVKMGGTQLNELTPLSPAVLLVFCEEAWRK